MVCEPVNQDELLYNQVGCSWQNLIKYKFKKQGMMNFWQYANKNNFVIYLLAFYVREVKLSGLHGFLDSFNFLVQT